MTMPPEILERFQTELGLISQEMDLSDKTIIEPIVQGDSVLVGWILGRPIAPSTWWRLPAIPAFPPQDPDVAAANEGFLRHSTVLCELAESTEMMMTSVTRRLGGLVDGINPRIEEQSTETRLRRLVAAFSAGLNASDAELCNRASREFDNERNVLTHHKQDRGEDFRAVCGAFGDLASLYPRTATGSMIAFDQVGSEHADEEPPSWLRDTVDSELESWSWAE